MKDAIAQIVKSYSTRIMDKRIFFAPDIPEKKLTNALNSYAEGAQQEEPLVLIDNTTFGNAKDGALLTSTTLYTHNIVEHPQKIMLSDIERVSFKKGMNSVLRINDIKFLETNFPEKDAMQRFADMLGEIVGLYHPENVVAEFSMSQVMSDPPAPAVSSPPQEKIIEPVAVPEPSHLPVPDLKPTPLVEQKEPIAQQRTPTPDVSCEEDAGNKSIWPSVIGFLIGGIVVVPLGMAGARMIGVGTSWARAIGLICGVMAWSVIAAALRKR